MICPRCTRPLPEWLLRDSYVSSICPNCQTTLEVHCFPALYRLDHTLDLAQLALADGEACCYEHPEKRASSICSNCGRFLCALCEVQLGSQVLCPECLTGGKVQEPRQRTLDTQRTKFDSIALAMATWPLLIFYLTIITAPMALILSIFAWKRPTSIVRYSRWRIYLAMTLSVLEISGMVAFIVFFVTQVKDRLR